MILRRPVLYLTLVTAALFIYLPLRNNNDLLREDLILVAVSVILASNLNLMIGYTGYWSSGPMPNNCKCQSKHMVDRLNPQPA